jgi:hypothetical protein
MTKVLFILKYREVSDENGGVYSTSSLSSGLLNSARMVKDMLNTIGLNGHHCEAKLVQVIDNNDIDREVFQFKPDVVIIEAIWVVPEKFPVLCKLHPKVKWIIRNHSNIPFLAQEGSAFGWIADYAAQKNVYVATNTKASLDDFRFLVSQRVDTEHHGHLQNKVLYFPNYYIAEVPPQYEHKGKRGEIHVGCFGAIRPLKNHLEQAFAALKFAKTHNAHLFFHMNVGRTESGGSPILKNIRALFRDSKFATLVEHGWMPHAKFVELIAKMDVSVQVSFSETFNIVTADAVMMGVPVVVSREISWVSPRYQADPTSAEDIMKKMEIAIADAAMGTQDANIAGLNAYNKRSHLAISNSINSVLHHVDRHI